MRCGTPEGARRWELARGFTEPGDWRGIDSADRVMVAATESTESPGVSVSW